MELFYRFFSAESTLGCGWRLQCSELEKENDELKKSNEDQALHIEHLEEQILKRNKMLFGQKSEKSKFICNGQMDLDGNVFNEAEEFSNLSAAEPTEDSITKKSKKTGKHRGRNELRGDLETKEIVHTLPEDQRKCAVCGSKLVPFSKEYITTRLCIIPAKILRSHTFVRSTNVNTAISTEIRRIL